MVDQLTRVLVRLYEETDKPPNGVEYLKFKRRYLKKYLGSNADTDVDKLKHDYEKVREDNTRLRKQIEEVRKEVQHLSTQIEKAKADE